MSDKPRDGNDAAPEILAAFEKWVKVKARYSLKRMANRHYLYSETTDACDAWQAACEWMKAKT